MRAIASSPAASVQPQPPQQRHTQHPEESGETVPSLEVGDGNSGGLKEEAKLSLPVRAYFFSTRYGFPLFSRLIFDV